MIYRPDTCDPNTLEAYLAESLSGEDERRVEQHLESCSTCRLHLQESAAEAASWDDAGQFLRDEPIDIDPLSDDPSEWDVAIPRGDALRQVIDMLDPTDDPRMIGRLAGYEIMGVVGSGGMGVVLKGFDTSLNRYVAIKVLAPHLASSGAARTRFAREAQAAAAVVHQHVIAIHSVSADYRLPYLVMPYSRGMSLQKRIDMHGPLSIAEILRITAQTAAGLAAAHAQGLVHRDIKPANILLEDGVERVAITDFGLARAVDDATTTRSGVIAGTPQYMSPEQARGESIDLRSDLFSLGSVMYAMCTGHSPFRAETTFGILRRITDSEPRPVREVNSTIPEWLTAIIDKLHAKSPADRFQSAGEVAELMERCLAHIQQPTLIPLPAECASRRPQVFRAAMWIGAIIIGSIGALLVALTLPNNVPPDVSPKSPITAQELATWGDDDEVSLSELDHDSFHLESASQSLFGPGSPTADEGFAEP